MNLKKGLKIHSDLPSISKQLFINDGTNPSNPESELNFLEGSYVPQHNWRSLNVKEERLLISNNTQLQYSKCISIGNISSRLKNIVEELNLKECSHPDEVQPKIMNKETIVKNLSKELDLFLNNFSSNKIYKFHRITRAMPKRETITCHYFNQEFIYIGLHIDQSRDFTIHSAHKSGNRMSINLSNETRSLIFINLSLIQVFNMIKEKINVAKTDINSSNIAYLFFKYYPDYPAVRLEQKPYQYYVAPTDNFFHDASTLNNTEIDITIVYTGVFDLLYENSNQL
ncbi:hypothetical protein SAMN04488062_10227 [Flavobacterium omnivorum]|uniref:Uncharacterized protein n=1 Tax=Flavobacterium omnivorum TaxID=178355 RepID=A0A1G7WTQ1_9FLAO|nr:hypothetical protein [Flavobacterium omnivorum]SDG75345.1 hypothetical protein SAMN04488062_10227 [Flavobacterium omnivorum]